MLPAPKSACTVWALSSSTMPINWSKPWSLRPGVKELELSVGYPNILGIHRRRFRAVALADHLDEALAGVDLVAEHLAEIAGLSAEYFLNDRRVA